MARMTRIVGVAVAAWTVACSLGRCEEAKTAETLPVFEGVRGATVVVRAVGVATAFDLPERSGGARGPQSGGPVGRGFGGPPRQERDRFAPKDGRVVFVTVAIEAIETKPTAVDLRTIRLLDAEGKEHRLAGFALGSEPGQIPAVDHLTTAIQTEHGTMSSESSGTTSGSGIGKIEYEIGKETATLTFHEVPSIATLVFVAPEGAKDLTLNGLFGGTLKIGSVLAKGGEGS